MNPVAITITHSQGEIGRAKSTTHSEPFPRQALVFTCLQYKSFENTVGK